MQGWVIVLSASAYLGVLFAIAYWGDKRADSGRSIIANPYIYALSMAVYATTWTFYGSVGRAAGSGVGFLPIYLGPTLMAAVWWFVLRKIIRISKTYRITSIADFISSRYGKSPGLGGLVTIIAVVGIVPYISLQLKAISSSFIILEHYPRITLPSSENVPFFWGDTTFYIAMLLAAFTIVFGTRHLDASERHEGMVAAIAFESLVKLLAFLVVGAFVTFGLYNGFGDIFSQAMEVPDLRPMLTFGDITGTYGSWFWLIFLSMLAIMFLPRQFQVSVVENVDEKHLNKAIWLFPLYLLAINIFVLPIAFAGLLTFRGQSVDADLFVLTLPLANHQPLLALLVFIGGLSAATGMVIVETIALSTMVCNDLVMPVLLRLRRLQLTTRPDLTRLLLGIRRGAIVLILVLGYLYFRIAGEAYALVSIGLISFAAVAQFGPAILGGLYWRGGTRLGALAGLSAGFLVWTYTLLLPSFARSGWLPVTFMESGPFGIEFLRPLQLFGLEGLDQITHAMMWSMLANVGLYVGLSLRGHGSATEHSQASLFVDIFRRTGEEQRARFWRGKATVPDLQRLVSRFLGPARTREAFADYQRRRQVPRGAENEADADFVQFAETVLAGTIGAASARIMVASATKEEALDLDEVMTMLDDASQVIEYSHELERKSRQLEAATTELRAANERLQELDRLKDDFVSTISHELRTPLTSIRAFSEILHDHAELGVEQRSAYLDIIVKESERLTRLINQVLDLAKIESGTADWEVHEVDLRAAVGDALAATSHLLAERPTVLDLDLPADPLLVLADRDRVIQVTINLLSNAVKFCDPLDPRVSVRVGTHAGMARVDVRDNGPGVSPEGQQVIFDKFRQAGDTLTGKPQGTGLGLPISRQIISHLGGEIWVESVPGQGSVFSFTLPLAPDETAPDAGRDGHLGVDEAQPPPELKAE